MQVVYVDVLFLINFSMDLIALRLAGALLHLPARRFALLLAAALGGAFAVVAALFPAASLLSVLISGGVAALLCYIAYGTACGRSRFFAVLAFFFVSSWLIGGMITAFYEVLSRFFGERQELLAPLIEGDGKLVGFFLVMAATASLLRFGRRRLMFRRNTMVVKLFIHEGARSETMLAMVDSGNTLCDPLSGKPCILLDAKTAERIIPPDIRRFYDSRSLDPSGLSFESRRRIRLIPSRSIGGERLLVGYVPSRVQLAEGEGEACSVDAVLVLSGDGESGFCGYGALVPAVLIS